MTDIKPYAPAAPGDLITAELFNRIQVAAQEDAAKRIEAALKGHQYVDRAKNADTLEQKTAADLTNDIVEQLKALVPGLTGHRVVYKRLQPDEPALIEHGLGGYPVVDVCELERFPVVASADGKQWYDQVHWFLYHRTEMKIRRPEGAPDDVPALVTIEESRGPAFKQKFEDVLLQYEVKYDGQTSLGDVVNELWKKLFSGLNDVFDETSYANSPWFDRCCGDRRTMESLRRAGELDDLYVKVVPRKTINSAAPIRPLGVEVVHYDRNRLGLVRADFTRLTAAAVQEIFRDSDGGRPKPDVPPADEDTVEAVLRRLSGRAARAAAERGHPEPDELFLMVVLKV